MKYQIPVNRSDDFETDIIGCPHCGMYIEPTRTTDSMQFHCLRCGITSIVTLPPSGKVKDKIQDAVNRFNTRKIC